MSTALCPVPDTTCERCTELFLDEHPGADVFAHTYHFCDCPLVATVADNDICVGCEERRDLWREYDRTYGRRAS